MAKAARGKRTPERRKTKAHAKASAKATAKSPAKAPAKASLEAPARGRKPLGSATLARLRRQLLAVVPTDPEALAPEQLAALRTALLDRLPKDSPPP